MKLVDLDTKVTALLYSDEKEETVEVEMTVGEFLDEYTVEGLLETPLVIIPPHGRLIDADALDTSILQAGFSYAITRRKLRYTPGEVRQKIANAPTIIPASKEDLPN